MMVRTNDLLDIEIREILAGQSFYGKCEIREREVAPGVVWVGSNGVTSSVGQWIRVVMRELKKEPGAPLRWLHRWFCEEGNLAVFQGGPLKYMWYFGAQIGDTVYACGGCTDFSGEGHHGKQLADHFLEMLGLWPSTNSADHLISLLTDGCIDRVLKEENIDR